MNEKYPIGRLVMCPQRNSSTRTRMGIVVKCSEGMNCKLYIVKTNDGALAGPYLNHELIDIETNTQLII
jgi:hypothetical protein